MQPCPPWRALQGTPPYDRSAIELLARAPGSTGVSGDGSRTISADDQANNWKLAAHPGQSTGRYSKREEREGLSYLQLIELGVVAAMRQSGVTLEKIREAREYLCDKFGTDFPFARYRFKTDGKSPLMDYDQIVATDKEKLLALNENGQLAWNQILSALLHEFEYDTDIGTVLRWRVAGRKSRPS
jgi:hypothetical protein